MSTKYRRVYANLKTQGFSPAKALEILFDAKRGDEHALTWVKMLRTLGR